MRGDKMNQIITVLVNRLVRKGMEPVTIPAYFRDLTHAIADNRDSSLNDLNRRMRLLGWNDFELDDHTLQLITTIFENGARYGRQKGKSVLTGGSLNINRIYQAHPAMNQTRE
jgi:hypothetical protein